MLSQTSQEQNAMNKNQPLLGRIAIVTGSGRGLGAATAVRLAHDGADVVINDINEENARTVAATIEKLGRRTLVSAHDVSSYAQANALVDEVKTKLGRVDVLVNNAGIIRDAMLHKLTEEKWDEVIRINLKGPFNMGQACAKAMIEQKFGRIVNLASVAWLGNIGQTNYAASKAGVVGMTRTWALELARHGITANAIAPGLIDSVLTQQIPAEVKEKFVARIPLKRIGQPEEIASLVAFLASEQAAYITGQCIQIDGGLSVGASGA
jgi:3-oxoacyl-(acyl-carrier-protein) reductase